MALTNATSYSNEVYDFNTPEHYTSYSGIDIVPILILPDGSHIFMGEIHTITYSTHRESRPVRILGNSAPIGFTKGSRTIAGSIVFTMFDHYAFYRLQCLGQALTNNLYPLADMLPPFDILLSFSNEYGNTSKMKIYGVTIVDEGATMSIDDMVTEQTFTFVARGIQPITGYNKYRTSTSEEEAQNVGFPGGGTLKAV